MHIARMAHESDRIVVVASGFGVWQDGRCVASARWADVQRVRALRRSELTPHLVCLTVTLTAGGELEVHERLPGWAAFVAAAVAALPGMPAAAVWRPTVPDPTSEVPDALLFQRRTRTG